MHSRLAAHRGARQAHDRLSVAVAQAHRVRVRVRVLEACVPAARCEPATLIRWRASQLGFAAQAAPLWLLPGPTSHDTPRSPSTAASVDPALLSPCSELDPPAAPGLLGRSGGEARG